LVKIDSVKFTDVDQLCAGFKDEFYEDYAHIEKNHFWFRTRAKLITWILEKYCHQLESLFEVGCGTGYILGEIAREFPDVKLCGSEIHDSALKLSSSRLPEVEFMKMDCKFIPYVEAFDVIGAFDVLEHISDDSIVLRQMHKALKKYGHIILTVPQHEWLWSNSDAYSCHMRRYSSKSIHSKLQEAGFNVIRSTSFISILLPLLWVSRFMKNKYRETNKTVELYIPPFFNALFFMFSKVELALIKVGINFPAGGSRLVIARKINEYSI